MTAECNWCTLKVDESGIFALMCIHTINIEEEPPLTEELVLDFLHSQGITYGISDIAINAMLENVVYEQYVCVAKGKKPTKGADGYFDFKKNTEDMKKKPLVNEDGTVDYKNSLNIATIRKGELLATYIPPTLGEAGKNVFGEELPSLGNGKKLVPLRGKGIKADNENINFYAEYSGHIVMDGTKVYIDKLYSVKGDLNIEHGNIKFDGDVEVTGDVRSGLSIESGGNIFIRGHVGACTLIAANNITIEKGIQGKNNCIICAGGDVVCKYIESCKITSGANIYADSVLDSILTADNQILVTSKSGKILGSEIYGMCGVIVKEAGNNAGTPTLIRAGLPIEYYQKSTSLTNQIAEINKKIESFNQHANDANEELRMQIMRAKIVLTSKKKDCEEELNRINEKISNDNANTFIKITGTVYEGVRIYLSTAPYIVEEAVKEVLFTLRNGEVLAHGFDE